MNCSPTNVKTRSPFQHAAPIIGAAGYHVIPVLPKEKAPGEFVGYWRPMTGWSRYCDERPTLDQVTRWYHNSPGANVGICLGTPAGDGLVVFALDFDPTPEGADAFDKIMRQAPRSNFTKAGAKGETRLYRVSHETLSHIGCNKVQLGELGAIDILAHGRQTVAPVSWHPAGVRYRLLNQTEPAPGMPRTWHIPDVEDLPIFDSDDWDKLREAWDGLDGVQATFPKRARQAGPAGCGSAWSEANSAALDDLDAWVPALSLYGCKKKGGCYKAVAHWRPSSTGKSLDQREAHLSISPLGIRDFGADQSYSAVDLVMAAMEKTNSGALHWLQERLGTIRSTMSFNPSGVQL